MFRFLTLAKSPLCFPKLVIVVKFLNHKINSIKIFRNWTQIADLFLSRLKNDENENCVHKKERVNGGGMKLGNEWVTDKFMKLYG